MIGRTATFLLVVLLCSCTNNQKEQKKLYFDIKGYFQQEAKRLKKLNPTVTKTVIVNGKTEQKKIKISDWEKELKSFEDGDINKDAWRNLFAVTKSNDLTIYTNVDDKITVKKLGVAVRNKELNYIGIFISNKNILYSSRDTLTYAPNEYYEIKKTQKISLMSEKRYVIRATFN